MNLAVRRAIYSNGVAKHMYFAVRQIYRRIRARIDAGRVFKNPAAFRKALKENDGKVVKLTTIDGLRILVRQNRMDATILSEVFVDECYSRGFDLCSEPIIVDVGGYIGDFALFAAKRLNASRVITCEPSPRNLKLLEANVGANKLGATIKIIDRAVTNGDPIRLDVDAPDDEQCCISAFNAGSGKSQIAGISLAQIIEFERLDHIDLLKLDCEGGEYEIIRTAPKEVLSKVRNIVIEVHDIPGCEQMLPQMIEVLREAGFGVSQKQALVCARRTQTEPLRNSPAVNADVPIGRSAVAGRL